MEKEPVQSVAMVCTAETFRPCSSEEVRWLDWDRDFPMARELWAAHGYELLQDDWLSFRDAGYTYCGVVVDGKIVSRAAVYTRAAHEWEAAAVWTAEDYRRRGYGKAVVSFATRHILNSGRVATCHTRQDNEAMVATARSVGFVMRG